METQFDSESYWNRSSSKAFSFDDDNDGDGGDDDSGQGARGSSGDGLRLDTDVGILNDDAISEASFDNSAAGSALNLSITSVVSDEALKVILQEQSMDDRILSKGVTPEEELKLLRRQIQTTIYNPSPEVTAHKLLLGKSVTLEVFKSLHEKEQLLDEVRRTGGGDAVIGVLLFLKKTLNRTHFHSILQARPWALKHYASYLKQCQCVGEAVELLQLFGKQQEAMLLQLQAAFATDDLHARKQQLRQLLERYAGSGCVVTVYQQAIQDALKLLELVEKERTALDSAVDLNSTPLEVLYACCRKQTNWKEQDLVRATSPHRLCAEQQISAAHFEWTALNERANAQAYGDLESVFERTPIWHPMKQKQFHISFALELAVLRLCELDAPTTVLHLFLAKMGNSSEKLALARRVKCTKAVIDALAALKDIGQLLQLKESLPERSEEQFYCDKALKGVQSKRWTTDNIKLKL